MAIPFLRLWAATLQLTLKGVYFYGKHERDIEKTRAKILEYQKRLKDLEAQKIEEENAQIVQMVKAVHLDGAQLAAFLSAYASGEIALPQPDADYTDEQEETEDEA